MSLVKLERLSPLRQLFHFVVYKQTLFATVLFAKIELCHNLEDSFKVNKTHFGNVLKLLICFTDFVNIFAYGYLIELTTSTRNYHGAAAVAAVVAAVNLSTFSRVDDNNKNN